MDTDRNEQTSSAKEIASAKKATFLTGVADSPSKKGKRNFIFEDF